MKVYVLSVGIYSGRRTAGVFTTREAAQAALPDRGRERVWEEADWNERPFWTTEGFGLKEGTPGAIPHDGYFDEDADIEEWELDVPDPNIDD